MKTLSNVMGPAGEPVPPHALKSKWSKPEAVRGLTLRQRRTIAQVAVETGCLDIVRLLVTGPGGPEHVGTLGVQPLAEGVVEAAAAAGQLGILQHLLSGGCSWDSATACTAAGQGRTQVCLWLLGGPSKGEPFCTAAKDAPVLGDMLSAAARAGQAQTCKKVVAARGHWLPYGQLYFAAGSAAAGGQVSLMDWLLGEVNSGAASAAAMRGAAQLLCDAAGGVDVQTLQRLHAQYWSRIPGGAAASVGADMLWRAALGHTANYQEKIEWLLSLGYTPGGPRWPVCLEVKASLRSPRASDLAPRLRFLQDKGFPLGSASLSYVLSGTQDEPGALVFLLDEAGLQAVALEKGAPQVAYMACRHGRMDSLQVLLQRGWLAPAASVRKALRACAETGNEAVAACVLDTLCGGGDGQHPLTAELFVAAAGLGSVPLLQQLRNRGCNFDAAAWTPAIRSGCEALLDWLHAEGCPMPVRLCSPGRCAAQGQPPGRWYGVVQAHHALLPHVAGCVGAVYGRFLRRVPVHAACAAPSRRPLRCTDRPPTACGGGAAAHRSGAGVAHPHARGRPVDGGAARPMGPTVHMHAGVNAAVAGVPLVPCRPVAKVVSARGGEQGGERGGGGE